jgi:hypothetical protein
MVFPKDFIIGESKKNEINETDKNLKANIKLRTSLDVSANFLSFLYSNQANKKPVAMQKIINQIGYCVISDDIIYIRIKKRL